MYVFKVCSEVTRVENIMQQRSMKPNGCLHSPSHVNLEVQVRSVGIGIHKGQIPQAFLMGLEDAKLGNRHLDEVELQIIPNFRLLKSQSNCRLCQAHPDG